MKMIKLIIITVLTIGLGTTAVAQSMSKKYKTVVSKIRIDASAERVWEAMVLDYGEISNFSPYIWSSDYKAGSLKGELGAERVCNFNEKGSQWVHEKIMDINYEDRVMRNVPIDGKKLPLNFDNSQAFYRVVDNGDGTATASYEFQYRTKPGFMTSFVKGSFKNQLEGTLIGLKHYVETNEKVTPANERYQEVKEQYQDALVRN